MKKRIQKVISLIICFIMISGNLPISEIADLSPNINSPFRSICEKIGHFFDAPVVKALAESLTDGTFTYTVLNGSYAEISGYTGDETNVKIPSSINGYVVQRIGSNAFENNANIKK